MKITAAITELKNNAPQDKENYHGSFSYNAGINSEAEQAALGKPAGKKIDEKVLNNAVDKANQTARIFNRQIHFKVHEASRRWIIQIIDTDKGEVVREIPPEKILDIVAQLDRMVGLLVDESR
ncbi:MAG: flagellar protein FlaG [Clostridia bacterium]|nr:flagellar protein FlaG [Clostridia bacterium]